MSSLEVYPIHNGTHHQWNYLEVIDRASGEVERIRLDDENSIVSVSSAAKMAGVELSEAWKTLLFGGHLTTAGFVRRLAK